jgi:hypothetical protein
VLLEKSAGWVVASTTLSQRGSAASGGLNALVIFTRCFSAIAKPPLLDHPQAPNLPEQSISAPMLELNADAFVMTDEGDANQ